MVVLDKSVHVTVAPAEAWRVVTAFPDAPSWCPGMVHARVLDAGPVKRGSRWIAEREDLGLRLVTEQEVVIAVPERQLVTRQRAGDFLAHETVIDVSPARPGTRVRVRHRVELPFVLPRFVREAEVRAYYSRCFDEALLNLKDCLEGRHGVRAEGHAVGAFMATRSAAVLDDGGAGGHAYHAHAARVR